MRLRDFAEALGINRNLAAKIAPEIPGAHRAQVAPGQVPAWILPENAVDWVTNHPEVFKAATQLKGTHLAPTRSVTSSVAPHALGRPAPVRSEFDEVEHVRAQVEAEEGRLRLQQVREAHQDLRAPDRLSAAQASRFTARRGYGSLLGAPRPRAGAGAPRP